MKNLPTYQQFINEGKYSDDYYYDDIMFAKANDRGNKEIPNQRNIAGIISGDTEESRERFRNAPKGEVTKYINTYIKGVKSDYADSKLRASISKELERLTRNIRIQAQAGVPLNLRARFVSPIFNTQSDLEYLESSKSLDVVAYSKVVNKFSVEYSGTVTNDKYEQIEFEKINNGLAVNIG